VAKDLLKKPVTFLCLQCHAGHGNNTHSNIVTGYPTTGALTPSSNPLNMQRAFFTDCTHCHNQIHGSDRASASSHPFFMR
jgi:hypothetical protein